MVQFKLSGREFEAIEQNRKKPSRWGRLAREKHQVVQFHDVVTKKYVAVVVDGEVRGSAGLKLGCGKLGSGTERLKPERKTMPLSQR
jgi:hypothetical protein